MPSSVNSSLYYKFKYYFTIHYRDIYYNYNNAIPKFLSETVRKYYQRQGYKERNAKISNVKNNIIWYDTTWT